MAQDYGGATTRMGMGQAQQHEPVHATTPPRTRRRGPGLDDTAQDYTTHLGGWRSDDEDGDGLSCLSPTKKVRF